MFVRGRTSLKALLLVLALALSATLARAGEVNKYLPEDTEVVVSLNARQIIDSPLFKKFGLDKAKEALAGIKEVSDVLKDLSFDPFRDVDGIVIGAPAGDDPEKGLFIVHGRFDLDKFKTKAEAAAKENSDHLKIIPRASGPALYEITPPDGAKMYATLVDKTTMLVSPGKDYVIDALKRANNKDAVVKNADVKALLERMDNKQSISLALIGSAVAKNKELSGIIPKELLDNLDALGGGITVGDDVKLEVVLTAKSVESAKTMNGVINENVNNALAAVVGLSKLQKDLLPAVDVVKSIKTSAKDKTVKINGEVSAEQLEKLTKAISGLAGM